MTTLRNRQMRELYESGQSLRQIAPLFGLSWTSVRRGIVQAGGKMRPKGTARTEQPWGLLGWLTGDDR
jgi:transposase